MKKILLILAAVLSISSCTTIGDKKITDSNIRSQISNGIDLNRVKEIIGNKNKYDKPLELKSYWEQNSERKKYVEYGFFRHNFFYNSDYTFFVFFDKTNKVVDSEYKKDIRPLPWITTKSLLEATFCPTYNPNCMGK